MEKKRKARKSAAAVASSNGSDGGGSGKRKKAAGERTAPSDDPLQHLTQSNLHLPHGLLRRATHEQAQKVTEPVTPMEFCLRVVWDGLGLRDFAVGTGPRVGISMARKAALGKAGEEKFVTSPPSGRRPPPELPSLRRCVDHMIAGDGRSDIGCSRGDSSFQERLHRCFDADALHRDGMLHLPGLVSEGECRRVLVDLASKEYSKGHTTKLRRSTGNGANGYYVLNKHLPTKGTGMELLDDLQRSLSNVLRDEAGVPQSGTKSILLHYGPGGVNWAHQDQKESPYQAVLLLSRPGVDFAGGQLYVTEPKLSADPMKAKTPREAVTIAATNEADFRRMGDVVVFAANGGNRDGRAWYHGMREVRPGSTGAARCHRIAVGLLQYG